MQHYSPDPLKSPASHQHKPRSWSLRASISTLYCLSVEPVIPRMTALPPCSRRESGASRSERSCTGRSSRLRSLSLGAFSPFCCPCLLIFSNRLFSEPLHSKILHPNPRVFLTCRGRAEIDKIVRGKIGLFCMLFPAISTECGFRTILFLEYRF